ncbi:MAG: Dna2/Cas4 domain-containing protein [Candidatus Aenigmatarchaeota archaeon]
MSKIEGVIELDGVLLFPISWLSNKSFCEYQLYLEKIRKIKVDKTIEMIIGEIVHKNMEQEFLEIAKKEMSVEDALRISKAEGESFLIRELSIRSKKYGIYGKIDEVQIFPENIFIIEDKPGYVAYSSIKKQVLAYSLCMLDQFKPDREIFSVLRNRDDGRVFWQEKFNEQSMNFVLKDILEVHDLIRGVRTPTSTFNSNKCKKCRFNGVCDRCLIK